MDYRSISSRTSAQWQYLYYEDDSKKFDEVNGLLIFDGEYIGVALGSVYGEIGSKYTITTDTGKTFKVVKIDEKSDQHTTNGCQDASGAIIEFVVDTSSMDSNAKFHGSYNVVSEFEGTIVKIEKER